MYQHKSQMSVRQQSRLLEHFVVGTTAIKFYHRLSQLVASKLPSYELSDEVEADESYFGVCHKGKRGRGQREKPPYLTF